MGGKHSHRGGLREVPVELPPGVLQELGADGERLLEALKAPAPVSIRCNPLKPRMDRGEVVPWCAAGRYLEERPVFTLDPLLHLGAYYVQEAGSMLVEQAFRSCAGLPADPVVLDLCAAPGGKSTHLAALLPREALLVCNEPVHARQAVLCENLWKWGRPDVIITGSPPAAFGPVGPFCDLVLVDAPCSGEGMFRKDPFARVQWSGDLVESCAVRQRGILDSAWAALRPGGYLIYSTCTWEVSENEDQVRRMMARGAEPVAVPVEGEWGVLSTEEGMRCYPHRVRGEGFFIALLRKPGGHAESGPAKPRAGAEGLRPVSHPPVPEWLDDPRGRTLLGQDEKLFALADRHVAVAAALSTAVNLPAPGIPVAVRKGGRWAPHPALALSLMLRPGAFPALDLDHGMALRYLRGEALPADDAKGVVLMRHQGLGMGWAHGAGTRWNNHWPAPWRIRMR